MDENVSKEEAVKLAQLYPNLENDEDNKELMKEVSKQELEKTLHSLIKDKITSIDSMLIGYLSILDTVEEDLLREIEVSRKQGMILGNFNATCISLVLKTR